MGNVQRLLGGRVVLGSMSFMLKYRHLWYAFPFDTEKHLVMTPEK